MKARIKSVDEAGHCNYCNEGVLADNGFGLVYPYDEVIEITGNYLVSKICLKCLKKLSALAEIDQKEG